MNKLKKFTKQILSSLAVVMLTLGPIIPGLDAAAKDASRVGAVYLEAKLDSASNGIQAQVSGAAIGNANWGQDTSNSPEYRAEGIAFGRDSWKTSKRVLEGTFPDPKLVDGLDATTPWKTFTTEKTRSLFRTAMGNGPDYKKLDGQQTSNMVLTFPGWAASDAIPDLTQDGKDRHGPEPKWDRNSDEAADTFDKIDNSRQDKAASAVNNNLVGDFNKALATFYAHVAGAPTLSTTGMANMVWAVAHGYFPASQDTVITYNESDGTFSGDIKQGTLKKAIKGNDIHNQTEAGKTLVTVTTPTAGKGGDKKKDINQTFTYAVVKGSTDQTGQNQPNSGADEYALTWRDIAMGALAHTMMDDTTSSDDLDSNSTVVGDQVNGFVSGIVGAITNFLGLKTVDQLVFGDDGSLIKNGTFEVYLALMGPFVFLALVILTWVAVDAYRKSNSKYLTTGQVQSIQSSIARIFNALLMIGSLPLATLLLVYADQQIVLTIKALDSQMSEILKSLAPKTGGLGAITGIIASIVFIFLNFKFTFKYIARAISFGIYFVTAPLLFAIDSLKGNGSWFEYGQTTAEVWKNIGGLVLTRSIDALGIVFALSIGQLIFGSGVVITVLGILAIETVSTALMGLFGIKGATINGIAEAGMSVWKKGARGIATVGGVAGGVMAAKGIAAVKAGNNLDTQRFLNGQSGGKGGSGSTSNEMASSFNTENASVKTGKNGKGVGSFIQGFKNKGVYGDGDSVNAEIMQGKDNGINLKLNRRGVAVGATTKDKLKRGMQNVGRFAGGAIGGGSEGFVKGNLKTALGATAAGISQLTPGHADDWISAAIVGNDIQNSLTGANRPLMSALGNSLLGRMVGMSGAAMTLDNVHASGKPHQAMKGSDSNYGGSTLPQGAAVASEINSSTGSGHTYVGYDPSVSGDRSIQEVSRAVNGLSEQFSEELDGGPMTREFIADHLYGDNAVMNSNAKAVLDHMDINGFDQAAANGGGRVSFQGQLNKVDGATFDPNNISSDRERMITNRMNFTKSDQFVAPDSGITYKRETVGQGADAKTVVQQYKPVDRYALSDQHSVVSDTASAIQKSKNISAAEKAQYTKQLYSSANNVDGARKIQDLL